MAKERWHIGGGDINEFVWAEDQFEAWDTLRDRPAEQFGLIMTAEPNESGDPIPVRTSLLMSRWGREADAKRFIKRGKQFGMPDTTKEDRAAPKAKGR